MNKRGISDLVATVLMILIAIVAAGLLGYFLMNWFKANTEKITLCGDSSLSIKTDEGFTCFTDSDVQIQVSRGSGNVQLAGIQLQISGSGASKTIEVRAGKTKTGVRMYGNQTALEIPGENEAVTYVVSRSFLKMAEISNVAATPIVKSGDKETLCNAPPSTAIAACSSF